MEEEFNIDYIVGKSTQMLDIYEKVRKVATHKVSVLIEGESGTGKELIARAIHYNSDRKENEFVVINCSAFADNLLESELFGHLKGSFTGALVEKKGLFEVADKGTFFLDEVADMSPALQVKLLRVLQEGTFLKIGGVDPIKVDVRIIAATNQNLRQMVKEEKFREDLFYRINVTAISLPPLRERKGDINLLVEYFLKQIAIHNQTKPFRVEDSALEALNQYSWPGNIRQLENEIERAVIFAKDGIITKDILSPEIIEYEPDLENITIESARGLNEIKKRVVEKLEKKIIREGLEKTGWNKTECAKLLMVSRGDLMRKIAKYGIVD